MTVHASCLSRTLHVHVARVACSMLPLDWPTYKKMWMILSLLYSISFLRATLPILALRSSDRVTSTPSACSWCVDMPSLCRDLAHMFPPPRGGADWDIVQHTSSLSHMPQGWFTYQSIQPWVDPSSPSYGCKSLVVIVSPKAPPTQV